MATLTEQLDNLYTSTWRAVRNEVSGNIFDSTPWYFWLKSKGKLRSLEGGRRIDVNLEFANSSTAAWIVKGESMSLNDAEILTTAQYNWRHLAGSIVRYLKDDLENRGKHKIVSLIEAKMTNVQMDLEDTLETALFAGSGTASNAIDGLQHLVSDTAAYATAVGGIKPSDNSWWRNKTVTMTGESFATFGLKRMRTMLNDVSKSKGNRSNPDIIISGQSPYEYYEDSLQPQQRFVDRTLLDGGFMNLSFKNVPMAFASACANTRMYFLNSNNVWLYYDPAAFFEPTEWKEVVDQPRTRAMQIYSALSNVTNRRKALGVIHTIDTE